MEITIVIHEAKEGGYWAEVRDIPGCASQGETLKALFRNLYEAIEGCSVSDDHRSIHDRSPIFSANRSQQAMASRCFFTDDLLCIQLVDGREIRVPLEWFPKLRDASEEERNNWSLIGGGLGIHFGKLDEDLSITGLMK